ncbi:MAG: hypothetical protein K0Q43_11 [Ramlibacter sp.]|nr:hypothetical protein [Ramlibacter sp.]
MNTADQAQFRKHQARAAAPAVAPCADSWRGVIPADIPSLAGTVIKLQDGTYDVVRGASEANGILGASARRFNLEEVAIAVGAPVDHGTAHQFAQALRRSGYAVAIFSPQDLGGVEPDQVEERLVAEGNAMIESSASQERPRG